MSLLLDSISKNLIIIFTSICHSLFTHPYGLGELNNTKINKQFVFVFQWKQFRELFEALCIYCHEQLSSIPLTFVLGFYVSLIVKRWWKQYSLLPWPDSMAMYTAGFLTGKEERQRLMRRNIIRYVLLSYCMAMRAVSFRVKKRFPDLEHLVDAGLMREDELKVCVIIAGYICKIMMMNL